MIKKNAAPEQCSSAANSLCSVENKYKAANLTQETTSQISYHHLKIYT